jgi:hypothetical protein
MPQVLLVVWCTEPYQTERLPGAGLLRNLLRRYQEQPAAVAAPDGGQGAAPAGAATYDEVIGEMFAAGAQGEYSGWVYTAPASKYDKTQACGKS